ncbi:expressed unknown protein [Seminavis robusta]|uniref:Uncharacterized protein n=1 Tax=Seminavis robusta TaxID=568900 RepID=A0A9N8EF45_9STRA|nr:expressed unknown protein [Seminavis robusta]|eukprot:Sro846_g210200.1 n/a (431) ;mRNA; f:35681-36973
MQANDETTQVITESSGTTKPVERSSQSSRAIIHHHLAVGVCGILLVSSLVFCLHEINNAKDVPLIQNKIQLTSRRNLRSLSATIQQCAPPIPGDMCYTEEHYGACRLLQQEGCRNIVSTGSCQPKFQCQDYCFGMRPQSGNVCHTLESYSQCRSIEAQGCSQITSTSSCPPSFHCSDFSTPENPIEQSVSQCLPPIPGDTCSNEETYGQCSLLQQQGCERISSTGCPARFQCTDPPPPSLHNMDSATNSAIEQHHKDIPTRAVSRQSTPACFEPDGGCHTQESYQQCTSLEMQGCQLIASTRSCPPRYFCAGESAMTKEPTETVVNPGMEEQCARPGDGCDTQESYDECLSLVQMGCTTLMASMSCPPQYQCAEAKSPNAPSIQSQCVPPGDACHTYESYQECLELQQVQGCPHLLATASCPPHYRCEPN